MPDRASIYTEARRWVGTPYHHQGRRIGQACDCIGLLIGVGRALGFSIPPDSGIPPYGQLPHAGACEEMAGRYLVPAGRSILPGQVGMFFVNTRGVGQHFCVFAWHEDTNRVTMIHAFMNTKTVVETGISDFWKKRLLGVYDYRECANG